MTDNRTFSHPESALGSAAFAEKQGVPHDRIIL